MFTQPEETKPVERQQSAAVLARAALYSFELARLTFIKEIFTKDEMYRLNKEQMFIESLLVATESTGVKLTGLIDLVQNMKRLSPNDLGRGRDEIVKILTPVPVMATLGTAYGEEQPGLVARILGMITGKGAEQK